MKRTLFALLSLALTGRSLAAVLRFDVSGPDRPLVAHGVEVRGEDDGRFAKVWDTTKVSDGWADLSSEEGSSTRVLVLNEAAVEGGRLAADTVWTAERTHVVRHDVMVSSNVTLRVANGAVVKFLPNVRIWIEQGGNLQAEGVRFADFRDDSVGGDTNMDGDETSPDGTEWWWDDPLSESIVNSRRPTAPCVGWRKSGLVRLRFASDDASPASVFVWKSGLPLNCAPTPAERAGYGFAGWEDSSGALLTTGAIVPTTDSEFLPIWTPYAYSARFDANGGVGEMEDQMFVYDQEQALSSNGFTRAGYDFAGWTNSLGDVYSECQVVSNLTADADDVVMLFAIWAPLENEVAFDACGGSASESARSVLTDVPLGTLPVAERTGYAFDGWFTDASGGDRVTSEMTLTASATFYAHWTPNSYMVAFDPNGGMGEMLPAAMTYGVEASLATNRFCRTGYLFTGWTDGEGTVVSDGAIVSNLTVTANGLVTLYANWEAVLYTLVYAAGGGVGEPYATNLVYDAEHVVEENWFVKEGATFLGWTDAAGTTYLPGDVVSNLTDVAEDVVTFTAKWCDDSATDEQELSVSGLGWHEVSFAVLPESADPADVFAPVEDKVGYVTYGSLNWNPLTGGTLMALEIGKGYWVQTTAESVEWTVTGQTNPDVEIALKAGWNLIGYPLLEEGEVETVLATEKIDYICSGSRVYPGTLTTLEPGKGYWVYANAAVTIKFDAK